MRTLHAHPTSSKKSLRIRDVAAGLGLLVLGFVGLVGWLAGGGW